jgi:hypothetical protein
MPIFAGSWTERTTFYSKATLTLDTSLQPLPETFELLRAQVRKVIGGPLNSKPFRRERI